MGITLLVLLQANTLTLYQLTTHIILIFSPTKIYFREVKINQELVQNQQTFQAAIPTSLLLLKPVAILPIITYNLIQLYISGNVPPNPPVGELPEHEHDVTCSNNGLHQHKIDIYNDEGRDAPYVAGAAGGIKGSPSTSETGNHSHTISINKTGGNFAHNNMQPYISVYCWRRTAQQPVGELPEHGHIATCSTNGEHVHTAPTYNGSGSAPNGRISEVDRVDRSSTVTVDKAGSHSHTISVSDTGKNLSHNNMSPYLSVYIWKRIA